MESSIVISPLSLIIDNYFILALWIDTASEKNGLREGIFTKNSRNPNFNC